MSFGTTCLLSLWERLGEGAKLSGWLDAGSTGSLAARLHDNGVKYDSPGVLPWITDYFLFPSRASAHALQGRNPRVSKGADLSISFPIACFSARMMVAPKV